MKITAPRSLAGCLLLLPLVAGSAHAQSGLSEAVLALARQPPAPVRNVSGRLFSGAVESRIFDRNSNNGDLAEFDEIDFTISGGGRTLTFDRDVRTRLEFEDWARDNAEELLRIIFPGSLSDAALGRDAAQLYGQQLILSTALNVEEAREPGTPRRALSGGLFEVEWLRADDRQPGDSGWAWQGSYNFGSFTTLQARYARQRADLATSAWAVAVDYHPYREFEGPVIVRIGATARTGFLYSHSESLSQGSLALDLGTLDYGGGGWASVRKDFQRMRVAGGFLVQGTKSFVPVIDDGDLDFLARVINGRGVSWDGIYGGTLAFDTSPSTAVIGKYVQARSLKAEFERSPLHLALVGYSWTLAPGSALDAGYKHVSRRGFHSGAVFVQGAFGW